MKFQYIQGLEFQLSISSIFQVFQDVYEPCLLSFVCPLFCFLVGARTYLHITVQSMYNVHMKKQNNNNNTRLSRVGYFIPLNSRPLNGHPPSYYYTPSEKQMWQILLDTVVNELF